MTDEADVRFAQYLLSHGFLSDEELARAREVLAGLPNVTPVKSLAKTLVQHASITPNQVRRALAAMKQETSVGKPTLNIPGYEVISRVGRGSQAVVFRAKQISMDRIVALKILDDKAATTSDFKERFIKEARSAAALSHNNIVQAYDAGEVNGVSYFVQEFVEGTTVADVMKERGRPFSETEALDIVIQIGEALAHAHSRGFIHRDVKPKNIMLTPQGVAKLADMGLARQASDAETAMAETGKAFGTPYYIAPEQIRGNPDIDFRADIYSLGATLYQMITGRVPFEAPSPQQVMQKHLLSPLVPPDHINTKLSSGISEVIEVMMSKKPKDRYASTKDLLIDLKSVRAGQPPVLARQLVDGAGSAALAHLEEGENLSASEALAAQSRPEAGGKSKISAAAETEEDEALPTLKIAAIVLAALLLISLVVNLVLLFK